LPGKSLDLAGRFSQALIRNRMGRKLSLSPSAFWPRRHYLSNRVFRDYDDVVEASSSAWNKLVAEQGRIASIGTRRWTAISQGP
jgi:hypothetical protein